MTAIVDSTLGALWQQLRDAGVILPPTRCDAQPTEAALFGSAVLALHGLRDEIGDVDLAVAPAAFKLLHRAGWEPTFGEHPSHPMFLAWRTERHVVHAFSSWRSDQPEIDPALVLERAECLHGWPAAPLALVAHHKATALVRSRELGLVPPDKHVDDLANIVARIAGVRSIGRAA